MSRFYILHECYAPNTASTVRLTGLLKELSACGIDTHVLFFIGDENQSESPELPHIHFEYYWKRCPLRNTKIQVLLFYFVYSWLFWLRVHAGDTVYLDRCDQLVGPLSRKKKVRVFQERTEHPEVSHFGLVNLDSYFRACRRLTGLFVISSALKELYIGKGVDKNRIHIINMTVDRTRFEGLTKTNGVEDYVAYCGSAMMAKDGLDQLLKAFSYVAQKYDNLKLYIIGRISRKGASPVVSQLIESMGISEKIVFTGVVPSSQMPQMLKDAQLLTLARPDNLQAKYGFPTKLGEYLLTGNPVVVTAVGDIPLFLEDGGSAFIAHPDSPLEFANKMLMALGNPTLAQIVGDRGRQVAIMHFDSKHEADKIISILFEK